MSGIFLQSVDDGPPIEIPLTKTVIGRGPFLQVTDKRVSRSHAELSVENKTLYITPTHSNPCFLRRGGEGEQVALAKDERCELEIGDTIGLLPDQLFYTVCGKEGAVNGNSAKIKNETPSAGEKSSPKPIKKEVKENDETPSENVKKNKVKKEGDDTVVRMAGKPAMSLPLDKKRVLPTWMIQMAAVGPVPTKKKASTAPRVQAVSKRGAEASPSKKRAPARRYDDEDDEEDDEPPVRVKKAASPRKQPQKKRKADSEDDDDARPARRRPRPSRRAALGRDDDDDDDDDDDLSQTRRPERAAKHARGSYVDDFLGDESDDSLPDHLKSVKDDDSDFEMFDGGDSGSDWENKGKGKKGKAAKPKVVAPRRTPGRRGRPRKARYDDDDDDDDDDDPDEYVPRPSKRRGGGAAKRKRGESEEEEEEEEEEENGVDPPAKKKAGNKGTKKKKKCAFGKKCYRKNPVHFEDYCHPDDASYEDSPPSGSDDDDGDDDRTNTKHRKENSHKKKATNARPQRKSKNEGKKSILDWDEDDDGEVNTYDYNDSFIDNKDMSDSESSDEEPDEDSDYTPGDSEDVRSLMKEAKGFVKQKKMRQPVGKKIEITPD